VANIHLSLKKRYLNSTEVLILHTEITQATAVDGLLFINANYFQGLTHGSEQAFNILIRILVKPRIFYALCHLLQTQTTHLSPTVMVNSTQKENMHNERCFSYLTVDLQGFSGLKRKE